MIHRPYVSHPLMPYRISKTLEPESRSMAAVAESAYTLRKIDHTQVYAKVRTIETGWG